MYCPDTVRIKNKFLCVIHHGNGDVGWDQRPLSERLNPLRYGVGFFRRRRGGYRAWINKNGRLRIIVSNFAFRLTKRGREFHRDRKAVLKNKASH